MQHAGLSRGKIDLAGSTLVPQMTSNSMWPCVFRRLLAREAGSGADAPAIAAATRRLCEHFARHLNPLIGEAGVAAINARSLHLAQIQFPGLAPAGRSGEGDGPFVRVQQLLEHQNSAVANEAAVAVLSGFGELLASFIGESLTTRLLRESWPSDFAGESIEETNT